MKGDKETAGALYLPLEPYRQGWLAVGGTHRLYWEESGNPAGRPVVFLHGGPGAGCAPLHRRFFDPAHYRIVLFDQRGSGRSVPAALVSDNTTALLVEDIESLRRHLKVERWLVFGGSWGSTLALAYGEAHPERCAGFVLRGIFLFRPAEVDWFLHQMGRFFPEAGRHFIGHLPPEERTALLQSYYRRLTSPDPSVHMPAAQAWCSYEESCSRLIAEPGDTRSSPSALAMARIEAHYMIHDGFLEPDQLLRDISRLHALPATIVQGRYDMVCPITSADDLARAWPGAVFQIVPDAGHSAMEPGIRAALVTATDRFRALT
ncbi:prolyl aminopeptidase [Telmatospirillum sp.]|uniref:prolyl aminopeptidase n=1 Tax=Telmatospirillum sp. TaxID=2079197 RepID=UPI00284435D7|nr:prolyl aminopeptidase [Telmatospirillum sp.]MDR3436326.1 prolyl aminopeptidase [Telmatospirillum sp.]